ncbi:hypothetical protein ACWGRF_21185 [Streptomyces zhihengii]
MAPAPRSSEPAHELTDAERVLLQRAKEALVRECMEREGFSYWVVQPASVEERGGYGYVQDDLDWAGKHGYGGLLERQAVKARVNDPNNAYLAKLPRAETARYEKTLDGSESGPQVSAELPGGGTVRAPRDGCRAEAEGRLYGDYGSWFRVRKTTENLTPLFVPDLLRDERFVKALGAWAVCMREAGHPYADPPAVRAAMEELTDGLSPAHAHATEVEVATAEARCATTSRLADTARSLEREYRDAQLRPYGDVVAELRRMEAGALARARDITDSRA